MKQFTQEDINNIIKLYTTQNLSCRKIGKEYGVGHSRITKILKDNGINEFQHTYSKYKDEDINYILEHYHNGNWDKIYERFPDISKAMVYTLASKHNVSHKSTWTASELDILYNNIHLKNEELHVLIPNHSVEGIRTKIFKLGLREPRLWSDEEKEIMKEYFSKVPIEEMMKLLPKRKKQNIYQQGIKLGIPSFSSLQKWNETDDNYIINNWKREPDESMAEKLHRTIRSIKWRRELLGCYRRDHDSFGYEILASYLRRNTTEWRNKIIERDNGKCIFTGSTLINVHHIYPVNQILLDTLKELNYKPSTKIDDYTSEQLEEILIVFRRRQNETDGVCISKEIHKLYHSLYGYINTPEQWEYFANNFKKGKYKLTA